MLTRLWNHLSKRRQTQFALMQVFSVIVSFFEMVSLGAVIPFLTVLAEPETIFQNEYMQPFISALQISQPSELALPITLVFILLTILSAVVRFLHLWAMTRLSQQAGSDLSINIYRHTLFQDYAIHVTKQ